MVYDKQICGRLAVVNVLPDVESATTPYVCPINKHKKLQQVILTSYDFH